MDSLKAKSIMKYVEANIGIVDKLCKGLKEIKTMLMEDKQNLHFFRKLGLTCIMFKVLNIGDERVQKWVLSIFTSCLLEKEFQEEVDTHENGLSFLVTIFRTTKCKTIKHRVCRVIGQQSHHDQSCSAFHKLNILYYVISFLKESKSDEEKETAIKTLRCLTNNLLHYNLLLRENGLYFICLYGLASPNENLSKESLKLLLYFNKSPNSIYFRQLMRGTDNLQVLSKLYEASEGGDKKLIRSILLTIFWHHTSSSSSQEYKTNCLVLDNLCMAKLPHMIVSELEEKKNQETLSKDDLDLILTLCKFCELDIQWEQFALNVLPSYHERIWMQLTDLQGIPLLVSLLASQRQDLSLLQALLRGLLGVEYLHCNRVRVLYYCLEARLLPLLDEIFDQALKEICLKAKSSSTSNNCHHFLKEATPSKRKSFSKEISKDLLDLVEQSHASSVSTTSTLKSTSPPKPPPPPTVAYKSMNKIKFRTGKRGRNSMEDRKRYCNGQEEFLNKKDGTKSSSCFSKNLFNAFEETSLESFKKTEEKIDINTQNWLNVLEYIIRLLYQIVSVKKDISSICRQFLPKVYHYICESRIVHSSALKLLAAIARNSSSIQFTLDIMFIPKLRVDLADDGQENCSQCFFIRKGVDDFLGEVQSFYNHYHQYGRCEVANRLHPSKPDIVKYSCIVAVAHVVRCPSLLTTFFLNHKGLETLLLIFNQPLNNEPKMQLYAVASLCSVAYNLTKEYQNKNKNTCVFCIANLSSVDSFSKKEHIIHLTSLRDDTSHPAEICKIKEETERNFTFRLKDKIVMVNKDKLSQKNDVFRAMLQGFFSESTENCISFSDVDSVAMEMVIHYVYGCTCDIFFNKDANIYTELLSLSQMYFVPELQVLAIHHLSNLLNADNIFPLIDCLANYMGEDILQHLICSLMSKGASFRTQEKWISQALASSLKDVFMTSIMDGLTRVLKSMSSLCNCDIYRTY